MSHTHSRQHAFAHFNARLREGLTVTSRRSVLKASLTGIAGLTFPALLRARAEAATTGQAAPRGKSVILLWMTGGPSHIDTWDVKPNAPVEIRGPFGTIGTKLPGVRICEYLPKQAAMMDKLTIIRSVDARHSNHEPNQVFQTGNLEAAPRVNSEGDKFPAIASIVAKHRGAANRAMPPSVVLNMQSRSHVAWGGYLGKQYDPFLGNQAGALFKLPGGLDHERIASRHSLQKQFDRLRRDLDLSGSMAALDRFEQQAIDIVAGRRAQQVFDHLLTTLVTDLEERGLLDDTLVIAMGEFGRTPKIGTQGSSDGRDHWPVVMSMTLAGGGMRHGQVIGSTERDGGAIAHRPVTPGDLAATIYHHMGVPLDGTYLDSRGRPRYYVEQGAPIGELV